MIALLGLVVVGLFAALMVWCMICWSAKTLDFREFDEQRFADNGQADSEPPSLHDVRALGKWDTDGLTAVEFLQRIRDAEQE